MNEKRFSSNFYEEEGRTIADNGNELTQNEVVDLLNELNYENKELKKENEQLRKELDSFKPVMFQDMRKGTITLYSKGGTDE